MILDLILVFLITSITGCSYRSKPNQKVVVIGKNPTGDENYIITVDPISDVKNAYFSAMICKELEPLAGNLNAIFKSNVANKNKHYLNWFSKFLHKN